MEQSYRDVITGQPAGSSRAQGVDLARDSGTGAWGIPLGRHSFHLSSDASLFSSSLPVFPHQTLNYNDPEPCSQPVDDSTPKLTKLVLENEGKDPFEDGESNAIGSFLPDDEEELLAGIMNDLDLSGFPSQLEDLEDYDLFGSGGGMELDFESQENHFIGIPKTNPNDGIPANGISQYALSNGLGAVAGEHPYGEHPSRTLFVRNINSNVEDSELKSLFEIEFAIIIYMQLLSKYRTPVHLSTVAKAILQDQYGDIRTLYTACKHRGFVMISYFDIRDARAAMRALQNKPLRRRKLDIHFSIPKDNPSEKDVNQGTLVVFNLDPSVSNDELRQIFGAHGEIKEVRETPHKRHHKFIEFYDVRAAEAALRVLNKCDIAGKRIKLEPSRPGGARRNFMQQLNHEFEQDEAWSFRQQIGSPLASSPPGNWPQFGSPVEHNFLHGLSKSPGHGTFSPVTGSSLPGLASLLPLHVSNATKIAPIGKDQSRANRVNPLPFTTGTMQGTIYQHSHSFPDQKLSTNHVPASFGVSNATSHGIGTLSGPQFLWGSPNLYSERSSSSAWPTSSLTSRQGSPLGAHHHHHHLHHHHHVGSAPSGVPLDRHFGFFPESPDTSLASPLALGGIGVNHNSGNYMMNVGARGPISAGIGLPGNISENGSPSLRMMSLPRYSSLFVGNGSYGGPGINSNDAFSERSRNGRIDNSINQTESKFQYQLDLEKIVTGEDTRTTLMIKNIPNKYTSKMLLAAIDEGHSGTYDFFYLPIDFKNKCNVGYAFINMISPAQIIPLYKAFNGKKWDKFNSEKVASLAYARIQGKAALVAHFQNSSLMNEDKWCRPILFQSDGHELSDQENSLCENLNIYIRQPDGSYSGDLLESPRGQS